MGEYQEINQAIHDLLRDKLEEEGYEHISTTANNKIADLIDAKHQDSEEFEHLVSESIKIIKLHPSL